MRAILGKKIGMTRLFGDNGKAYAVTVVEAAPNTVLAVKTKEKDGYFAYQIGVGEKKTKRTTKSERGKYKDKVPAVIREFRETLEQVMEEGAPEEFKVGDTITVESFRQGETVDVSGITKGKGFAGTIKRHNFSRGPKTHGSHNYRAPGSIGSMYPEHVIKGRRMPGRMGAVASTIKNATVAGIDKEKNLLLIAGGIPGPNKGYVMIKSRAAREEVTE